MIAENSAVQTAKQQERRRAHDGDSVVDDSRLLDHAGVRRGVGEQEQERTPDREFQSGAIRRHERHRHHVEEDQEEQRAAVPPRETDRERHDRAVDQDGPRHHRGRVFGSQTSTELDDGDEHQVSERDPDHCILGRARGDGNDEQRDDDQEPDELQDEQPVGDRRSLRVGHAAHRNRATSPTERAVANLRSPRSNRRWIERNRRIASTKPRSTATERPVRVASSARAVAGPSLTDAAI